MRGVAVLTRFFAKNGSERYLDFCAGNSPAALFSCCNYCLLSVLFERDNRDDCLGLADIHVFVVSSFHFVCLFSRDLPFLVMFSTPGRPEYVILRAALSALSARQPSSPNENDTRASGPSRWCTAGNSIAATAFSVISIVYRIPQPEIHLPKPPSTEKNLQPTEPEKRTTPVQSS